MKTRINGGVKERGREVKAGVVYFGFKSSSAAICHLGLHLQFMLSVMRELNREFAHSWYSVE